MLFFAKNSQFDCNHATIGAQGETSLTAGIFGAFAFVLLDGRQPACVVRMQNHSKIPG